MFDIGFAELLLIAVLGLLVLGPERLPTAVRTISLWLGRLREALPAFDGKSNERSAPMKSADSSTMSR